MSDDRTVRACPHCDHANIRYRPTEDRWYCDRCARKFAEPNRRPPKRKGTPGAMAEYGDLDKSDLELFDDD